MPGYQPQRPGDIYGRSGPTRGQQYTTQTGPAQVPARAAQPTPEQQAAAAAQTKANPMRAVWNPATGTYEYVPLEGQELNAWQQNQANQATQAVQSSAPQAPVNPVPTPGAPAPSVYDRQKALLSQPAAQPQPALRAPASGGAQLRRPATSAASAAVGRADIAPATQASGTPTSWQPVAQDTGRYDAEAARLRELQSTFLDQLGRLSQADPFGNQAALQKSTDRAVSQAAGTAAGARGGAAALAGAQRQAVGVQAQTSARGAQDIIEQRRRDEQQATGLGLQAISGAAQVGGQLAQNELALGDQAIKAAEVNLRGYLGGQELGQRERDSRRNLALEASQIDMQRYQTDMQYRQSVDQNLTQKYIAGTQLEAAYAKIKAEEDIGAADWLMGTVGLVSGIAGGVAQGIKSDERAKTNIRRPSTAALREFVMKGEGKMYEYREPHSAGARPGENFGPMAQDLQKSAIGRTLVKKGPDGHTLMVDTQRLALADHSALTHLAKRLERLERRGAGGRGKGGGRG